MEVARNVGEVAFNPLWNMRTSEREHCDKGVKAKTVDTRRRHKKKASDAVLFRNGQTTRIDAPPSFVTLSRVRATKYRRPRGCKVVDPSDGESDVMNADGARMIASPVWRVTTRSNAGTSRAKFPEKCFET
jgi:hypothetical protein